MSVLIPEEIKEDADFALSVVDEAKGWEINDDDDYENVCELLKDYKRREKVVTEELEPAKTKTYAAYKDALDRFNKYTKPYTEAIKLLKGKGSRYLTAKENKRKEEERKAEEALKKAEEEKKKAEAKRAKGGDLKDTPPAVTPPPVAPTPPAAPEKKKVAGVSNPEKWKAEITDHGKLLAHIATLVNNNDKMKEGVEKAFLPWLQKHAEANQNAIPIPGVEFKTEIRMTVRA